MNRIDLALSRNRCILRYTSIKLLTYFQLIITTYYVLGHKVKINEIEMSTFNNIFIGNKLFK